MIFLKPAGFILKIDDLGRIVIPKPIRTKYDLTSNDNLELFTESDGLFLKKYGMSCVLCGNDENLTKFKDKTICEDCLKELKKS